MSKQKEIEEMAKFCCCSCEMYSSYKNECTFERDMTKCDIAVKSATQLVNAGYGDTKQAVKKAFDELKKRYGEYTDVESGERFIQVSENELDEFIKELYGKEKDNE